MSANDDLLDIKKQNKKVKLQHMFQNNNGHQKEFEESFEIDDHYNRNMSKIAKSYRSFNDEKNLEIKTNSLVSCAKGLIESSSIDLTKSLYEYLEELRSLYNIEKNDGIIEVENKKIEIENPITFQENNENVENTQEHFDINNILKTSEQEISNIGDQKLLLRSLIDDINVNSKSKYDDIQFQQNIKEIMKETQEEIELNNQTLIDSSSEDTPDSSAVSTPTVKKSKLSIFFILTIVILLGIAGYAYWDIINEFIKPVIIKINEYWNVFIEFVNQIINKINNYF